MNKKIDMITFIAKCERCSKEYVIENLNDFIGSYLSLEIISKKELK